MYVCVCVCVCVCVYEYMCLRLHMRMCMDSLLTHRRCCPSPQVGNYAPMVWSPALADTAPVRANPNACGQGEAPTVLVLVQVEMTSPFFGYFLEALASQR